MEHRVGIDDGSILLQSCGECRKGQRLGFAENIVARVFNGSTRPPERFLAGPKVLGKRSWGNAGNSNGSAGYASAAINHIKAETIRERIWLRLVNFDDDIFLVLRSYFAPRIDLSPIEHAHLVQVSFGGKQVVLFQRLPAANLSDLAINQLLLGFIPAQSYNRGRMHLWSFINLILDLQSVRLSWDLFRGLTEGGGQVSRAQIRRHDLIAI